jgi:hypothetical protein
VDGNGTALSALASPRFSKDSLRKPVLAGMRHETLRFNLAPNFCGAQALPCPPRDQSWQPSPVRSIVDRHYRGGQSSQGWLL